MNARQFHNLTLRVEADRHFRKAALCFAGTAVCWLLAAVAALAWSAGGCIGLACLGIFCGVGGCNSVRDRRIALGRIDTDPRL